MYWGGGGGYREGGLGGVEEHKSIILHLLSQLKLGMDLTKVNFTSLCILGILISPKHKCSGNYCHCPRVVDVVVVVRRQKL